MIITFNDKLTTDPDYNTIALDPGMKAKIVKKIDMHSDLVLLEIDWSDYIFENSQLMVANWPDTNNRKKLKWNQTKFYPVDHKTSIIVKKDQEPFDYEYDLNI